MQLYTLPELPYAFGSLEPYIDALTMEATNLVGLGSSDFTLSWNLEDHTLDIGVTKTATFTFTLTSPVSSTWSFDINVIDSLG